MGRGNKSLFSASGSHDQDGYTGYGKNPLKVSSGTKVLMALGLGMQYWGHWGKSDGLGLTLTFFYISRFFLTHQQVVK